MDLTCARTSWKRLWDRTCRDTDRNQHALPAAGPSARSRLLMHSRWRADAHVMKRIAALACTWSLLAVAASFAAAGCTRSNDAILRVGETWTTTVTQKTDVASPNREEATTQQVYRFKVVSKPSKQRKSWKVRATIDDAVGPFAQGFDLYYTQKGDALVLTQVAVAGTKPLDASASPVVLGQGFPLDKRLTARPTSTKISAPRGGEGESVGPPPAIPGRPDGDGTSTETGGNVPGDASTSQAPTAPPASPPG